MHKIYEWFRSHRFAVDFAGMIVLWAFTALTVFGGVPSFILSTLLVVPLAWRRSRPVATGVAIAVVAVTQWTLGVTPFFADVAVILVVYSLAAYAPRWASLGGLGLAMLGAIMLITRFYGITRDTTGSSFTIADLPYNAILVILVWFMVLFSWTLGDLTRTRRLREQALEDRARRLEIEQQQERDLAASDERAHIAREMHDIVAHSLSVIITQADGGRYAAEQDPTAATRVLRTIAETGRTSLSEMRRLLGVLRGDETTSYRPLPSLADLDELLLGFRAAGLSAEFTQSGQARRALPGGAELTVYRMVQEGLTNVLKHAGPQVHTVVSLDWQSRGLAVTLQDDGRGAAADPPAAGGGNGLRGMSERVKLYDGTLEAKAQPGGGFCINAFIPYTEA